MSKKLKIILISLSSVVLLLIIIGLILFGIYEKKLNDLKEDEEVKSEEVLKVEKLSRVIYDYLPNETSLDIIFKTKFQGYEDFIITYFIDSPYLNLNGVIKRDEIDHVVKVKYNISYKDVNKDYYKNITILKTTGVDSLDNIVNSLNNLIPLKMPDHFKLPTSLKGYDGLVIVYKKEVISKNSGLVNENIKVNQINEDYYVDFTETFFEEICFIEATITYEGTTSLERFAIYSK